VGESVRQTMDDLLEQVVLVAQDIDAQASYEMFCSCAEGYNFGAAHKQSVVQAIVAASLVEFTTRQMDEHLSQMARDGIISVRGAEICFLSEYTYHQMCHSLTYKQLDERLTGLEGDFHMILDRSMPDGSYEDACRMLREILNHREFMLRHKKIVSEPVRAQLLNAYTAEPYKEATLDNNGTRIPLRTLVRVLGNETFLTDDDVEFGIEAALKSVASVGNVAVSVAHADLYLGLIAGPNDGAELDTVARGPRGTTTQQRLRTTIPQELSNLTVCFPICLEALDADGIGRPWHWTLAWIPFDRLCVGQVNYCDTYGSADMRRDHIPNGIVKKLAECINEHSNTAQVQTHDSLTQEPPIVCHFGERQHESECGVCVVEGVRQLALGQSVGCCQPPRGQARADLAACLLGVEGVEYIIP
jgi:hypothetical protein